MEKFVPASGNRVLWYTCGPTVYDACHMGHARAYLTLDILRRIMEDYFGYDVLYHINITDIDDKIILRARQGFLLDRWLSRVLDGASGVAVDEVAATVDQALDRKAGKLAAKREALSVPLPPETSSRDQDERETALAEQELKEGQLKEIIAKVAKIRAGELAGQPRALVEALVDAVRGEIGELLDSQEGGTVTDHDVFNKHSRKYEMAFLEDMEALGVRPPDVLTRVTEYVEKIVAFVAAIVDKGLAYESNGSVYLSIDAFKDAGHSYRKLSPFSGDTSEADMAEGEGAIGTDASDKRNPNDFALWKKSKPGEPEWLSPWGKGRPGWHIECSVIASDILGPNMDVHAGGVDLKFPHHDNELAQSEAYYGHSQWVNYFFHAGHLHIKGLKMSKSLKNFITIRQALEHHSPRQIRIMFLLQAWDKPMNYSDQTVEDAKSKESLFRNFFGNIKDLLARKAADGRPSWLAMEVGLPNGDADRNLVRALFQAQQAVHERLCDNFDTPGAMLALCDLVKATNTYLASDLPPPAYLLRRIASFITQILRLFGVVEGGDDLGFPLADGGGSKEETLRPYLDAFRDFRQEVRTAMRGAASGGGGDPKLAVMAACDRVRDEALPGLGVRLEDLSTGASRWKLDDPAVLVREIEERRQAQLEQQRAKREKEIGKRRAELKSAQDAAIPPQELLPRTRAADFKAFDEKGMPTLDAAGEPVAKAQLKKLGKVVEKHGKNHDKLRSSAESKGLSIEDYIATLEKALEEMAT